jgi:acyl carrier protein
MTSLIEVKLKEIIVDQIGVRESEIKPSSLLREDLGVDSLDMIEITMAIEEEFGFDVPDDDVDSIKTFQDVVDYVQAHKG